jgi:PAS domain S-box-containing protein
MGAMNASSKRGSAEHDFDAPDDVRETLDAITSGSVDAVVVHGPRGPRVFRLEGPDEPFRTFVERMQEGAITLSADGNVLYANEYFAQLLGVPLEKLLHAPLSRFVPSRYHSTLGALIREGVSNTIKGQCQLESKLGPIPVQLTLGPLAGGSVPSCCGVVFDLRQRQHAEEAHAARIAAEQASAAKDQFLAVISHELRSPLNAILGWSQILLKDPTLGPNPRRALQTIERNARTQAELIGDLLDISRIIAGKLNLELSQIDFAGLVQAALAAARPAVEQKSLTLEQRLAEDADVYGDSTRLQQIVTNLLNNALKFTDRGGRVEVALETEGSFVVLRVSDSGVGMTPELVERVFDVFHQGGTVQRRKGGLGLGLAIARQLAEAHGGTLRAESPGEGLGSTFTLRLPRASKSVRPVEMEYLEHCELRGLSALVVDDVKDALDLARYLLESAGCRVVTASSAEDALALLETERFGLIVSDIGLPDQDGLDLMREIRARGFDAEKLPAIALTGFASIHEAELISAAGYQKHIAKPLDASVLLTAAAELGKKSLPS